MKTLCFLSVFALSAIVTAQESRPRTSLASASDPTGPASGWALASDPEATMDLRPLVEGHGPAVRITSPAGLTLVRPAWSLSGTYSVAALFQRRFTSEVTASYGLVLGAKGPSSGGIAFLIRPDGMFSSREGSSAGESGPWTPTSALRPSTADGPGVDRLEVRVGAANAVFVVNGTQLAVIAIAPGALDGRPGVHVGANGEVFVAGFAIAGPRSLFDAQALSK